MPAHGYRVRVMTFGELMLMLCIFARAYLIMSLNMVVCVATWRSA